MKSWSDRPFAAEVPVDAVAARLNIVSPGGGEAMIVYEIAGYPGWLVKRYRAQASAESIDALRRLIDLPGAMHPAERALVDNSMAWPVSRVVDGSQTVGVVVAKAPDTCYVDMAVSGGRTRRVALVMDHLANPAEQHVRWGLQELSVHNRLTIVRSVVEVGNLIENMGLVYGDWSYSNAFWSRRSLSTFVIDVDSCRFGLRPWVEARSGAFSDPLLPEGQPVTALHDRYRLALLSLRCLTGSRGMAELTEGPLPEPLPDSALARALRASLTAQSVTSRPSLPELLRAFDEALELTCPGPAPRPRRTSQHLASGGNPDDEAAMADSDRTAADIETNVVGWRSVRTGEIVPAGRALETESTAARTPEPVANGTQGASSEPVSAGATGGRIAISIAIVIVVIILIALIIGYFG